MNDYLNFEFTEDINRISEGLVKLDGLLQSGELIKEDLNQIKDDLVETGKFFAKQQGFSEGHIVKIDKSGKRRVNTGTLIKHIKARKIDNENGVKFYNDANLGRGIYAAHMEYGFKDRGGNSIPARPFMRPALHAVVNNSGKVLSDRMAKAAQLVFMGEEIGTNFKNVLVPYNSGPRGNSLLSLMKTRDEIDVSHIVPNTSLVRIRGMWFAKNNKD